MKARILTTTILTLLLAGLPRFCRGSDLLDNWTWRNPLPTGNHLQSVAHGNGLHVAVGEAGTIFTSADGTNWVRRSSGTSESLNGIIFANDQFVAVGGFDGSQPATILTSPDGLTWTVRASGVPNALYSLTYGNDRYVAVGWRGITATSSNGINWRVGNANAGTTVFFMNGVAYGAGLFVAVGSDGAIRTSPDAVTWTLRSSPTDAQLRRVSFGAGLFVATGDSGTLLTSPNGITWTARNSGTDLELWTTTYAENRFVTVGYKAILTSPDTITWTPAATLPAYSACADVEYGDGFFVAVGFLSLIATSPDGDTWTERSSGFKREVSLRDLIYGDGQFVSTGYDGTTNGNILTSPDGYHWTQRNLEGSVAEALAHRPGQFVAAGGAGSILTSPDGATWTPRNSRTTADFLDVIFGGGQYVACGSDYITPPQPGTIVTSPDGTNWTVRKRDSVTRILSGAGYGNGLFVVVGALGAIQTSTNGITWTPRASGTTDGLRAVTFGKGLFVAVGEDTILTSLNGTNWVSRPHPGTGSSFLTDVIYGNGVFVALDPWNGGGKRFLTSPDGTNWTSRTADVAEYAMNRVGYGNGQFLAVGDGGRILACDTQPRLGPISLLPTGGAQVAFAGVHGLRYSFEASTNLTDWSPVVNAIATNGTGTLTDPSATDFTVRFYRAASQP